MEDWRRAFPRARWLFVVVGVLIGVFLLAPIVTILPLAFTSKKYLLFPPTGFSWQWFQAIFSDPSWRGSMINSARLSLIGAAMATVCGTSAALAVRRMRHGKAVVRTSMLAPIVMPQLILALGLYLTYRTFFGSTSLAILVIGQATIAMPLVFVNVSAGLSGVDPNLSRAAQSLGYRWFSVVRRIELPLVKRSVFSGAIIAFAICFDEAVLAYFLAPPATLTLPVKIWRATSESATPMVAAASAFVIALALTLVAVAAVLQARPKERVS